MKRLAFLGLALAAGLLFAAGCGGGSSKSKTAQLRFVNGIGGGVPGFDVLVGGASTVTNLGFNTSTAYITEASGSEEIEFRNTGTTTDLINTTVSLTGASNYTFIAMGIANQPTGVLFTDQMTAATSGNINLRIINASAYVSAIDVFFIPSTSTGNCYDSTYLNSVAADISGLGFGSASSYKTFAAGSYGLCVMPHGTKTAYLATGTTAYASGTVQTIVIEDNGGIVLVPQTLIDVN